VTQSRPDMSTRIKEKVNKSVEQLERARAEFNFRSLESHISRDARVLDVGAWACYLGQLLKDRLECDVLSLDVTDANKTSMPFRLFDGRIFPVESKSFDVVLLLYVLHHAADDEILMKEARRVCAEDGCVIVAEDSVDGLWNRWLTFGLHVWLKIVARLGWEGRFRPVPEWQQRFQSAGFSVLRTVHLGHHLGKRFWPNNILFVLKKSPVSSVAHKAVDPLLVKG